jgi:plasmid stabilization system protein ParE
VSGSFITPDARKDILAIWAFIAADSIHHADLVEEAILATCDLAAAVPRAGHRRPEFTRRDILFLPVTAY